MSLDWVLSFLISVKYTIVKASGLMDLLSIIMFGLILLVSVVLGWFFLVPPKVTIGPTAYLSEAGFSFYTRHVFVGKLGVREGITTTSKFDLKKQ